jgi:micrococcal nuclease
MLSSFKFKIKNPLKNIFQSKHSENEYEYSENKDKNLNINYNNMEPIKNDNKIIKWEDTVEFTFPITGGQVIKVYDGDTITIASKLPFADSPLYRLSVRLDGIDTPEIKSKSEDEKTCAKEARDELASLILNKEIQLKNIKTEKYGRILADVYFGEIHINQWLIEKRMAVKYGGGTKIKPTSWRQYKLTGQL